LKNDLKELTAKLEEFIDKNRQKKLQENRVAPGGGVGGAITLKDSDKDEGIRAKEAELKQSQNKI
jgi:hypothetical protein